MISDIHMPLISLSWERMQPISRRQRYLTVLTCLGAKLMLGSLFNNFTFQPLPSFIVKTILQKLHLWQSRTLNFIYHQPCLELVFVVSCSFNMNGISGTRKRTQETLNELRGFLLLYSHMLKSKDRHIRGQRLHTRSIKLLSDVESKIQGSASKYRRIWTALEALSLPLLQTTWKKVLRPLVSGDVMGLSSMDNSQSEGRKKLSWIWKVHRTGANVDDCTKAGKLYKFLVIVMLTAGQFSTLYRVVQSSCSCT